MTEGVAGGGVGPELTLELDEALLELLAEEEADDPPLLDEPDDALDDTLLDAELAAEALNADTELVPAETVTACDGGLKV